MMLWTVKKLREFSLHSNVNLVCVCFLHVFLAEVDFFFSKLHCVVSVLDEQAVMMQAQKSSTVEMV